MRVDGRETVEVSEPEPGVVLSPSERQPVRYDGATVDGSKVFFNTETPLTAGTTLESSISKLYEYDTEAPKGQRLKLIANGVLEGEERRRFVLSEDGSTIYYETPGSPYIIFRYEIETGKTTIVAEAGLPETISEHSYTTSNGEFLVFFAGAIGAHEDGVVGEPRGADHNELYRYDHADGSVICVSCGSGVAPARGKTDDPTTVTALLTNDEIPPLIPMSEDGQRVFFQTSAQLVPQDTNVTSVEEEALHLPGELGLGADVYEWEADGTEEAPGVICRQANGCTHLISSGEDTGPSTFLGASGDGRDVFFSTAAQLVPQATPEFGNIYDARIDGGFPPPPPTPECLSCQGVGSPPLLFSPGASGPFAGADNPPVVPPTHTVKCSKGKKLKHGKCVKRKATKKQKTKTVKSSRKGK
jgi:hypothetical protein